jgi:alpha-beta hydrolase superfamily lysophospholipase
MRQRILATLAAIPLGGGGHGIHDESTRAEVYERMLAFLARHLGTVASPTPPAQP